MMVEIDGCYNLEGNNIKYCAECNMQLQSDECQGYRMKHIKLLFTINE